MNQDFIEKLVNKHFHRFEGNVTRRQRILILEEIIKEAMEKWESQAHQDGRDELLKELSITKDLKTPELRRLKKTWEDKKVEEVVGMIEGDIKEFKSDEQAYKALKSLLSRLKSEER